MTSPVMKWGRNYLCLVACSFPFALALTSLRDPFFRSSLRQKRPSRSTLAVDPHRNSMGLSDVKVLGVCGGIASGKSKACEILVSELGCLAHIDSDSLAHSVYEPGSQAIQQVMEAFGEDLLHKENGTIDRKKLGAIVFADPSAMSRLEQIVWPHVKAKVNERIQQLKEDASQNRDSYKYPVIVLEGAVLLDAGWEDIVDGVWVVTVPQHVAQQRLETNRGLSAAEAEKRILSQQPRRGIGNLAVEVSNQVVSAVVANFGDLDELRDSLKAALDDPKSWYSR